MEMRGRWGSGTLAGTGDDPAITGEPPEEPTHQRGPSRTGRVRPVTAGQRAGDPAASPSEVVPRVHPCTRPRVDVPERSAHREETMSYPKHAAQAGVPASPNLPAVERGVLDYWAADKTFVASVENRAAGDNEYVFYDGPPFANGLPHYGHLLTGYVKDVVPRYQTMRGKHVERRFGWDTHGLPAEVTTEQELGLKHKSDIEEMGVAAFNEACRASVLRYTSEWRDYVTRQARWVDFDNDYKTLDLPYMESVMWAFKSLWDKGLIYAGFRVLWYCWRDETPLAATETKMDDAYQDRQDPAVTVGLRLTAPGDADLDGAWALVWTTTPWTLPSNLAMAVGTDIDYALMEESGVRYILAEARLPSYERELANAV